MHGSARENDPAGDGTLSPSRRLPSRFVLLDRALEVFPIFRLSDSSEESAIVFAPEAGGRWRVLPNPGDRLPGTFDQDVFIEVCRRYHDAGGPADGVVHFTLHAFLRSIGRRADGRTYEQLRSSLSRLERTTLESNGAYWSAATGSVLDLRFSILSGVSIDRRRTSDREQLALFPSITAFEPGDARVILSPPLRSNISVGHVSLLSSALYFALSSPVARRLYRLLEVARAEGSLAWRLPLSQLAERVPLTQRYPSHLQRVLQPAHEMLVSSGIVRSADVHQVRRQWVVDYVLASRPK